METLYFYFANNFRTILGEYKRRAVYKRQNVVGNGRDSVLETSGAI